MNVKPKQTVAVIPARGGSKGVPRKNLRLLAGKPLIVHTIEQAKAARSVDQVYVSTDDAEIERVSREAGAEVIVRPPNLARDDSSSEAALQHALTSIEQSGVVVSILVFLQCTSPIRQRHDIDGAIRCVSEEGYDSVLSVVPSHRFIWQIDADSVARPVNYDFKKRPRRQDFATQYVENGSIYVLRPEILRQFDCRLGGRIGLYCMAQEALWDIDSEEHFRIVERLLQGAGAADQSSS